MIRTRGRLPAIIAILVLGLGACAAGPNEAAAAPGGAQAGFWLGLWQGLIIPITFLISLFDSDVTIYEVNNNGNWYDVGFMLGISAFFFVFGPKPRRRRSSRRQADPKR